MTGRRRDLADRRKNVGYTQEQLAEAMHVEPSTIGRWERGETEPLAWCRPKLARLLRVSSDELQRLLRPEESRSSGIGDAECLRAGLTDVVSSAPTSELGLDEWEDTVARYGQVARFRAPAVLAEDVVVDLDELRRSLRRCRSATSARRLRRSAANLTGLVCLSYVKLGRRRESRGWARTAWSLAEASGDMETMSWVRAQEAYGHFYSGDLHDAIAVAAHARALAAKRSTTGAVLAAALEARAYAAMSRAGDAIQTLSVAESAFFQLDSAAVGTSAFGYDEAQLRFHESNVLTHLMQTESAWIAQQRALTLCGVDDYTDRTLTLLDRARCLVHEHDVRTAVAVATDALGPLAREQRAGIISARTQSVIEMIPTSDWRPVGVDDLRDLLVDPS